MHTRRVLLTGARLDILSAQPDGLLTSQSVPEYMLIDSVPASVSPVHTCRILLTGVRPGEILSEQSSCLSVLDIQVRRASRHSHGER